MRLQIQHVADEKRKVETEHLQIRVWEGEAGPVAWHGKTPAVESEFS